MLKPVPLKKTHVAEVLENKIRSGDFMPGDKLPSMRSLGEYFNVSTMVMQQATEILEKKGLLTRSSRSGLFVAKDLLERQHRIYGVLTTILPRTMEGYYEGLFSAVNGSGSVVIPVYAGKSNEIRNLVAHKPLRVFIDLDAYHSFSIPELQKMLHNIPCTFFHRYEWEEPMTESGMLLDYVDVTLQALRFLRNRGHERIVFLSHDKELHSFKIKQFRKAAEIVGMEFGSPEFDYCGRFDFDFNPDRLVRIFKKNKATAIFSRSDSILFEFMSKLSVYFPETAGMDRIGCFNSLWSQIPGKEFSSFAIDWELAWKQVIARQNEQDPEWFSAKLIER